MQNNLRDDFAKRAMEALINASITETRTPLEKIKRWLGMPSSKRLICTPNRDMIARESYKYADAMMAEREKRMTNG